jgi:Ser/Thr protein kinase RdoA (MazF antagonist)
VEVRTPRVLSDRSNLLVRLAPAPLVARVATSTAGARARGARDWLARDVAVARFLGERGAAVVPPASELPPGPHVEDGMALTFWRSVEHDPEHPPTPEETGAALRRLHEALEGFPGELPPFAMILDECAVVIERLEAAAALAGADPEALRSALEHVRSAIARAAVPPRPLHGDTTRSNLLRTPAGLVWTDFEDTCSAPAEWDLACLVSSLEPAAAGALEAYGRPIRGEALEPFVETRRLQTALWTAFVAERHPELRARAAARLSRWAV